MTAVSFIIRGSKPTVAFRNSYDGSLPSFKNRGPTFLLELSSSAASDDRILSQQRKTIGAILLTLSSITSSVVFIPSSVYAESTILSASDVLQSDITPKINTIKDILFTFQLYPQYIKAGDYLNFRQALRTEPAASLRKSCRSLKPFILPDTQKTYEAAYQDMIEAVNEMDVVSNK